jgi:rhamnosyltransferase
MTPETSVIIRTKNEERWIGECLRRLARQTYRYFEMVAVDSGSTDRTLEIVGQSDARLFRIPPEDFLYPYALNYGCERARATKYLVMLSAHSLPVSDTWLADGIAGFADDRVMGVYGCIIALPDGSIWEKIRWNRWTAGLRSGKSAVIEKDGMGVLGFTNAIIRKELWEAHRFDEAYGAGGEDGAWARYWFARGYVAVRSAKFSVYHSHGLGLRALRKQWRYWGVAGRAPAVCATGV